MYKLFDIVKKTSLSLDVFKSSSKFIEIGPKPITPIFSLTHQRGYITDRSPEFDGVASAKAEKEGRFYPRFYEAAGAIEDPDDADSKNTPEIDSSDEEVPLPEECSDEEFEEFSDGSSDDDDDYDQSSDDDFDPASDDEEPQRRARDDNDDEEDPYDEITHRNYLEAQQENEKFSQIINHTAKFSSAHDDLRTNPMTSFFEAVSKPPSSFTDSPVSFDENETQAYLSLQQILQDDTHPFWTTFQRTDLGDSITEDDWQQVYTHMNLTPPLPPQQHTLTRAEFSRMDEAGVMASTLLLDPQLSHHAAFDSSKQRVGFIDTMITAETLHIQDQEESLQDVPGFTPDEPYVHQTPLDKYDFDDVEFRSKVKLIKPPEVLQGEHRIYTEDNSEHFPDSPIIAYSEAMQLASGGRTPILKDSSKDTIYQLHLSDPSTYTPERLSQIYHCRVSRIKAILAHKAEEARIVSIHGPAFLRPDMAEVMEEAIGAVATFADDPERNLTELVELNSHAPTVPIYSVLDGAADQRKAGQHLWKAGREQRHYYLAPEDIPRAPTPKTPPVSYLDPGLTRALPLPKKRTLYSNWDPDINPLEEFAIVRETDGTIRTPTFEERLRYLYLPMYNLLPDRFRQPQNATHVKAPFGDAEYNTTPPTYVGPRRDWTQTETILKMVDTVSHADGLTMDEAFDKLIQGTHGDEIFHATETASSAVAFDAESSKWARNGVQLDADDESFLEHISNPNPTEDELQHEVFGDKSGSSELIMDDLCPDTGDSAKKANKFVNFGEFLHKTQQNDDSPSGSNASRRGPPLPRWLSETGRY